MIIDLKQKRTDIEKTTEIIDDIQMSFDKDSISMQFKLFISGIYSNPIGTIVREITSNSIDANKEANNPEPVVIRLNEEEDDTYSISFIDRGVGMSPERVRVYASFLSSTKRSTNSQIGGFGIGGKSILSYKRYHKNSKIEYDNSYYIITRHDGIEYGYMVYEGESSPMLTVLYSNETTERNGTEIKIPVLSEDIRRFVNEMKFQLYYFENVLFVGFDDYEKLNNYNIYEGNTFYYRGENFSNYIHVTLGKVPYRLDYSALGLDQSEYRIPVAIKLPINSIPVTVSRENLDYSKDSVEIIKEHLDKVKKEIIEMFDNQNKVVVTLADYMDIKPNERKFLKIKDSKIDVSCLVSDKINYINFKYNHVLSDSNVTPNVIFHTFFDYYKSPKTRSASEGLDFLKILSAKPFYREYNEKIVRRTNAYLRSKYYNYYTIVPKQMWHALTYLNANTFVKNFSSREEYATFFNELVTYIKTKNIVEYSKIVVPDSFRGLNGRSYATNNKEIMNCLFVGTNGEWRENIKLSTIANTRGTFIYGTKDFSEELKFGANVFNALFPHVRRFIGYNFSTNTSDKTNKSFVAFLKVSKSNEKKLKEFKNCVHISDVVNKYYRRLENTVNELLVQEKARYFMSKYENDDIFRLVSCKNYENINPEIHVIANKIKSYKKTHKYDNVSEVIGGLTRLLNIDKMANSEFVKISDLITTYETYANKIEKKIKYIKIPYYLGGIDNSDFFWEIIKLTNKN